MDIEAMLEFDRFKEDYKNGLNKDKSNNYLDVNDYEDDFPNKEISEAQNTLSKVIKSFLEEKRDDNYRVYHDWCVHVMHNDVDKKIKEESRQIADKRKVGFEDSQKNTSGVGVNKYRKKPVVIEAMQYLREENISAIQDWFDENNSSRCLIYNPKTNEYYVKTLESVCILGKGDFIIRGVEGEFYSVREDIFKKTYEKVK